MQTVGSTDERAAHFSDGTERLLSVVRQAGSKGPVRRRVADRESKTAIDEIAGHGLGCGGMAVFGRTLSRREYLETTRVGDCFGSLGPAA